MYLVYENLLSNIFYYIMYLNVLNISTLYILYLQKKTTSRGEKCKEETRKEGTSKKETRRARQGNVQYFPHNVLRALVPHV